MASSLPADASSALIQLVHGLTTADKMVRSAAEEGLKKDWIESGPERLEMLLIGLTELGVRAPDVSIRGFCCVMLRQVLLMPSTTAADLRFVDELSPAALERIRTCLLQGLLMDEQTPDVRRKIVNAIGEVAQIKNASASSWPDLLNALFQGTKNQNASIRECAFRVFAAIPELVGIQYLDAIVPVFNTGLSDSDVKVNIATISAFTSFFATLPKSTWPKLHSLLPQLLSVMGPMKENKKDDELSFVFEHLIALASLAPKIFKPMFKQLVGFCVEVAKDKDAEEKTRLSSLELLVTFSDEAPNMCKKDDSYASTLVLLCLELLTEVGENDDEEASEWKNDDDVLASDDDDEIYDAAKQSLDRLALKLGGNVLLGPLFQWLPQLIDSDSWRARHAALMAISNVAEGCREEMIGELDKVLDFVMPKLQDPHCRVQWATCNALGQLSTDFADYIQIHFHARIVPALISKMDNNSTPRVQAHAAAAMVNFSENATKEILEPYLDSLLTQLLGLLQSPKRYVQEQVVTTIAVVADSAKSQFIKYYDTLMSLLFNVMSMDTGKEHRMLKAKSIEASTLIASAVGKEKFAPQFEQTVKLFASIQTTCVDDDDPCGSYLAQAWSRICRIMGRDFLPYFPGVLPPLIAAAKHQPDWKLFDNETSAENELASRDGWETIPIQGKVLCIHTALLDEKESAIDLLSIYAAELGADFGIYVKDIMEEVIIPSINFFYHDGVRYSASQAIAPMLLSVADALIQEAKEQQGVTSNDDPKMADIKRNAQQNPLLLALWAPALKKLLEVLKIDETVEILSGYYICIAACTEIIGSPALTSDDLENFVQSVEICLKDYAERVQQRAETENDDYVEDVEEDDDEAADEDLVDALNKAIHNIMKAKKTEFLPSFEKLLPLLSGFLQSNDPDSRQFALCAIDDLIEYCGPASWKYKDAFIAPMFDALVDADATVRQVAAYGIGVAAQHGGPEYAQVTVGGLETLFRVTNVPEARSEENIIATENASAAIAKILRKNGSLLGKDNFDGAVTEWIKTLPIVSDDECAPFAYLFLADMINQRHQGVLSQVPKVFEAVSSALVMASIKGKTASIVVEALKGLLSQASQSEVLALFNSLPAESQPVVQKWFA